MAAVTITTPHGKVRTQSSRRWVIVETFVSASGTPIVRIARRSDSIATLRKIVQHGPWKPQVGVPSAVVGQTTRAIFDTVECAFVA